MSVVQRALTAIVDVRREEIATMLRMFAYSFLAMTAYNIVKPLTRAQYIDDLGAENLPYVLLFAGVLIGFVMQAYSRAIRTLPPKSVIPATQIGLVGLLAGFWVWFQSEQPGAAIGFYFFGLIMGLLLISQFWTLANDIYDPRQAKRLFGFIGGGASLGGALGSAITWMMVEQVGTNNLLLVSGALLLLCAFLVTAIVGRARVDLADIAEAGEEKGVGRKEAFQLLRESRHLQVISVIIAFAAIGASILEQQLNMATQEARGAGGQDAIAAFLGQIGVYLSLAGFVIQVGLTSRIHRVLGIGFALLILPAGLGLTSTLILGTSALWAAGAGRVLDTSLRYTVDKTTREILFLPLPAALKYRAKPFIDVTVDRNAKAVGALIMLVLIQPWGLGLTWPRLSYASLTVMAIWIVAAIAARRRYRSSFRETIAQRQMTPTEVRINVADPSTIETLVEELAHPDEPRVLYAIDVLESLDKRNLVTPLLLHHESAAVRARALTALGAARPDIAARWSPVIQRMIRDDSAEVRAAAVGALAAIRNEDATALARTLVEESDPRIVATAAVALAASDNPDDRRRAQRALTMLAEDTREGATAVRRDLAAAIRQVGSSGSRLLLIPLLHDPDPRVAEEAMRSVRALRATDVLFAPTLISLLGNRRLKSGARETLVGFGPPVVEILGHFLRDQDEDIWVRRHIPATLARIPGQTSMDLLVAALDEPDGFLRFKVLAAIEKLRRDHPELTFKRDPIERLALKEGLKYFDWLSLHHNLFVRAGLSKQNVLARALEEKLSRVVDRIYRLLGMLYPWREIAAARRAIEHGDARTRASAFEYLDNLLAGNLRHRLLPVIEDLPLDEKVRRGNVLLRTRPRDVEDTMLHLINDDDQIVAATAIDVVRELKLWSLVGDLEHVLAHRDPRDWFVFEAASWTLAAHRLGYERRRALWTEPMPAAALVKRLRGLPMFASVGIDELFRLAATGHQVRHDVGAMLFHEGAVPEGLHVLLEGAVRGAGRRSGAREIPAPAALGFEEVLDGRLMTESIRTTEPSVTLVLSNEEMRTLLAGNTDLIEGLFSTLLRGSLGDPERIVLRGRGRDALPPFGDAELTPIQRVLVLQRVPVFSQVSAAEMLPLAAIARQIRFKAGEGVASETDPPVISMVLAGELSVTLPDRPDAALRAEAGDSVGLYQTLAGVATGDDAPPVRLTAAGPGSILRIDRDDLFDLLGQRPDLLQQIFSALFGQSSAAATVSPSGAPPADQPVSSEF